MYTIKQEHKHFVLSELLVKCRGVRQRKTILKYRRKTSFQMKIYREYFCEPNLRQNGLLFQNVENLTPDSESALPRQNALQFSGQADNFDSFGLHLRKFPNYVRYFGSNNVEGVGWVETEMSQVEVGGAGRKWIELVGGVWSWVELGEQFINTLFKKDLFIEALCRPLFTKYAHCKPLFPFQNNA